MVVCSSCTLLLISWSLSHPDPVGSFVAIGRRTLRRPSFLYRVATTTTPTTTVKNPLLPLVPPGSSGRGLLDEKDLKEAQDVLLTLPIMMGQSSDETSQHLQVLALSLRHPKPGQHVVDTSVYMPQERQKVSASSFMFTDPVPAAEQFRWTFQTLTGIEWDERKNNATHPHVGKYRYHPLTGIPAAAFAGHVANPTIRVDLQKTLRLENGPLEVVDPESQLFSSNCCISELDGDVASVLLTFGIDASQKHDGGDDLGSDDAKFYYIQLVKNDSSNDNKAKYGVITRWGSKGTPGLMQELAFEDEGLAQKRFAQKFREKTGRKWSDRHDSSVVQPANKYAIMNSPLKQGVSAAVFASYAANPSIRTDLQQVPSLDKPFAVVDPEATHFTPNCSIAELEGAPASALLLRNETDAHGNKTVAKFYFLQLVQDDSGKNNSKYGVITRWGTDGFPGFMQELAFEENASALQRFVQKFREKTGRKWHERHDLSIEYRTDKYSVVEPSREDDTVLGVDYANEGNKAGTMQAQSKAREKHLLDPSIALRLSALDKYEVFYNDTEDNWYDTVLTQCNIGKNSNKFIRLQVVVDSSGDALVWQRWGRVGDAATLRSCSLIGPFSLLDAQQLYKSKYRSKTRASSRGGKYEPIEIDSSSGLLFSEDTLQPIPTNHKPCTLHPTTQQLMEVIFSADTRDKVLSSFGIDLERLPLGIPSKSQINSGIELLDTIDRKLRNHTSVSASLEQLSSLFYTAIPHSFRRRQRPLVLNDAQRLQEAYDKCDVLMEMLSTTEKLREEQKRNPAALQSTPHPADVWYNSLQTDLSLLRTDSKEYDMIANYFDATKGHGTLLDVWKVDRHDEGNQHLAQFAHVGNRRLLWHGTNMGVVAPILTSGLRIMPHSGGRVGSGIYMASLCEKSQQYTPSFRGLEFSCMMLCEAALGNMHNITEDAPSLRQAPDGTDSVLAVGECSPAAWDTMEIDGRVVSIPQSGGASSGVSTRFYHDEFLVYNEAQLRLRYIVSVKV